MSESREKNLQWCKDRALEYVERGDLNQALTSMGSDLTKFDNLSNASNVYQKLFMVGRLAAIQNDSAGMRRFIEGFN